MERVLRTYVELTYEGKDITRDVSGDMLSFNYTDNEHGKADDMTLTLKDDKALWSGPWLPGKGDTVSAVIVQEYNDELNRLDCGTFTIDELTFSGPPSTVEMKGVSIPLDTSIRRLKKSRAWENVRLSEIAQDIANTGGIDLVFLVPLDPLYDRIDQREESDLKFLQRICEQEAYSVKVTDRQLVVFSSLEQEATASVMTIEKGANNLKSWSFKDQAHDLYNTVIVSYKDIKTGQVNEYTYVDETIANGRTAKLVKRADSIEEAERMAKAELRKKNRWGKSGTITLIGHTNLVAGVTITYQSGSAWDGKYLISKATHTVSSGYETSLEMTAVLE